MKQSRHSNRRGAVIPLAAILLVVVFGMVAFAIDVGYIVEVKTELQRTADSCALAAAMQLPDRWEARNAAYHTAEANKGKNGPTLTSSDVKFGYWNRETGTFTPYSDDWSNYGINAVKVTVKRTQAGENPLTLFFAPVFGDSTADVTTSAIAMYDQNLCGPLIGIESISVPGTPTTDSYLSSQGQYAYQSPRDNGSLCSDGPIGLEGTAIVNGDANAGKGFGTTNTGTSVVTGNRSPRLKPLNLPDVDMSDAAINNDNTDIPLIQKGNSYLSPVDANGNFLLDGTKVMDLPPGRYYLNDFTLQGQSTLNITGPTEIYLTGNLLASAGTAFNNNTKLPANLKIFMSGGTATVDSTVDLYGVIYAPNTDVTITGDSDYYGAFVGRTLVATGSGAVHYDEDLKLADSMKLPKRVTLVQ